MPRGTMPATIGAQIEKQSCPPVGCEILEAVVVLVVRQEQISRGNEVNAERIAVRV